jgi:hypothetical protein
LATALGGPHPARRHRMAGPSCYAVVTSSSATTWATWS